MKNGESGVLNKSKNFKLTDVYANRQMAMIGLNYGLKFEKLGDSVSNSEN